MFSPHPGSETAQTGSAVWAALERPYTEAPAPSKTATNTSTAPSPGPEPASQWRAVSTRKVGVPVVPDAFVKDQTSVPLVPSKRSAKAGGFRPSAKAKNGLPPTTVVPTDE